MIRVQREDFDPGTELAAMTKGRVDIGGLASFVGLVRGQSEKGPIVAMSLEHYPGMTEKSLQEIEAQAMARWSLHSCLIIHRYGRLLPGERIVMVATSSSHRKAALESCAFLIDWLKTKAPFWKLEEGPDGATWVEAKESDDKEAARWGEF